MKKLILLLYVTCVLAAAAVAFGVADSAAIAAPCFGKCGDPI